MTTFTSLAALQEFFAAEYPRMQRQIGGHFRHLDPDKREEAVSNTVALAWKFFFRLFEEGRATQRILKNVLWYAIQQTKVGRTAQGTQFRKCKCALSYRRFGSLKFEWADLNGLISDNTPVPEQVIFRVDVKRFFSTLKPHQQSLAYDLAIGNTTTEVARKHGVTPGAVSQYRRRFKSLYDKFFEE